MRLAISYVRWSNPTQRFGDSKRRQLEKTQSFCAENDLILDEQLVDDGKSAFKGHHLKKGTALSRFLEKLKAGLIPAGTIFIVESLDRLNRQAVLIALRLFLEILEHGVEIVTLIDRQWYSQESLGKDSAPLLVSLVHMMRAHDEVKHKVQRLRAVWTQKRKLAIESGTPMTGVCPGWLRLDKSIHRYKEIPARVKIVRLIFWLYDRGWSKRRITMLLNRHSVPTWGVGKKKANGWHSSYLQKILHNRAVLGEFVPHSLCKQDESDDSDAKYVRQPASAPIRNFYPPIINPAVFEKVQLRGSGPRGPNGPRVGNLFHGLLKDGEHPEYTMYYRDHGDREGNWRYVVSDYRRKHPGAPIFSWNYTQLETLLLRYLSDLDWSTLREGKTAEIRRLKTDLAAIERQLGELDKEASKLVALAKAAPDVEEVAHRLQQLDAQRGTLRKQVATLMADIRSREGFAEERGGKLIRSLAPDAQELEVRLKLQTVLRDNLKRIELFRTLPKALTSGLKWRTKHKDLRVDELLQTRCIRLVFSNGAEKWILPK